jgi:hypothetical protein
MDNKGQTAEPTDGAGLPIDVLVGSIVTMPPTKAPIPTTLDRCCNAWSWVCFGFMLGFFACAVLNEAGYTKGSLSLINWLLASATALIAILPRTILEIVRRVGQLPAEAQIRG